MTIMCRFGDIQCGKYRNLESPGQGSLKVIENGTIDLVWFPISVL